MANTVNVGASLRFSAGTQSQGLTPSPNYTQVGTHGISAVQDVTTTAEAMAVGDLANLKYAVVYNPTDSGATLTVTCAAQVLTPGDACLIRASSTEVTLQATGAMGVPYAGAEA
jgi:hypothetical protein